MSMNEKTEAYPLPELPQIPEQTFHIKDYGAADGGLSLSTEAIQGRLMPVLQREEERFLFLRASGVPGR